MRSPGLLVNVSLYARAPAPKINQILILTPALMPTHYAAGMSELNLHVPVLWGNQLGTTQRGRYLAIGGPTTKLRTPPSDMQLERL